MTLYALYVPGPDEIWPQGSAEAALAAMHAHNKAVLEMGLHVRTGMAPELLASHVIEWPHSAKTHAECLKDGSWSWHTPSSDSEFLEDLLAETREDTTLDMFADGGA